MIILVLAVILASGGVVACSRLNPGQPLEISPPTTGEMPKEIYIGGTVTNPGFYPLNAGDSIDALVSAAGWPTGDINGYRFKLYVTVPGEVERQRVNLNTAEVWLLEALPDIGDTLAQRIVDYRQQNGPFTHTQELMRVSGIGTTTYEQIEPLITVAD